MNIKKRVKAIFVKPERKLAALKTEFQNLRWTLDRAAKSQDPLVEIINFFDAVSRWHDRGIRDLITAFERVNYGQYDEVLTKLRTFQGCFVDAGRDMNGWNRTRSGETVTADQVFLGGIYGLFTKSVHFWQQRKDESKGGWGYPFMEHLNAYDVVSEQAGRFMKDSARPMIRIIIYLENLAA